MSTIERVAVTFGTKRNMGDYNSMELTLYLEARVDEGEDAMAVARELHERAVAEVKAQYRLRRPPRAGEHVREALAERDGGEGAARNRGRGIPIDGEAVDPPNFIPGYPGAGMGALMVMATGKERVMDRDRTGGPTSVGLYVNETRVASLRGVGDRYFPWAAARGVDALVPPFSGWVYHRCEDRAHAEVRGGSKVPSRKGHGSPTSPDLFHTQNRGAFFSEEVAR